MPLVNRAEVEKGSLNFLQKCDDKFKDLIGLSPLNFVDIKIKG